MVSIFSIPLYIFHKNRYISFLFFLFLSITQILHYSYLSFYRFFLRYSICNTDYFLFFSYFNINIFIHFSRIFNFEPFIHLLSLIFSTNYYQYPYIYDFILINSFSFYLLIYFIHIFNPSFTL